MFDIRLSVEILVF